MKFFLFGLILMSICGLAASNVAATPIINGDFESAITATTLADLSSNPNSGWYSPSATMANTVSVVSFGVGDVAKLVRDERIVQEIAWNSGDVLTFDWRLDLTSAPSYFLDWGIMVGLPDSNQWDFRPN